VAPPIEASCVYGYRAAFVVADWSRMPTARNVRHTAKNALYRAPAPIGDTLARVLLRGMERFVALRETRSQGTLLDNGLPVPPARLRVVVVGHADVDEFLTAGRRDNGIIRDSVRRAGIEPGDLGAVLDWGCGCGRVARWWQDLEGPAIHGCDYNGNLVEWVDANLPFVEGRMNELVPPLPYANASFDLIYALSVFTHLTDDRARAWMREIGRVLKPGGMFWFTTHGQAYRDRMTSEDQTRFDRGGSVVQFAGAEGTNACAAFHPAGFVRTDLAREFEVLESTEAHLLSQDERQGLVQDRWLVRRRPA
jgi:SAM-dependent methyltransferase